VTQLGPYEGLLLFFAVVALVTLAATLTD